MKTSPALLLILLVTAVIAAAGCSLFAGGEQSSPERVVEAYLEAFKSGDYETMVRLSGGWKGSAEEEAFTRKLVEMIELQSYLIGPVSKTSGSEVLVPVTVTLSLYGHERSLESRVRVVKKGSKWWIERGLLE